MDAHSRTFYVYVLRCPVTDNVRYVGVTRHPKSRESKHRSRKSHATMAVDVWTDGLARKGTPVEFQILATCEDLLGVGSFAVHLEESAIAYCRKAGYALLNADIPAIKRRKKPPASIGRFILVQ